MGLFLALSAAVVSFAEINAGFRPALPVQLPGFVDSNSPAVWWKGRLVVFTSDNTPKRSEGPDLFQLTGPEVIKWEGEAKSRWIEAAWVDSDGSILAWYHHEPGGLCPGNELTAPMIGAAISHDGGYTFTDLGMILRSGEAPDCDAANGFFAGGHGDFSVVLDQSGQYFYFIFTTYGGPPERQGIGFARLPFEARLNPAGAVHKYHDGEWNEPGLDGKVTPILPPLAGWETDRTSAFWGPSVHWNYLIGSYVLLMNRTCCQPRWPQEGIYLTVNSDLADPAGWTGPVRLLEGGDWYPQIIGLAPGDTSDFAGAESRLFIRGRSSLELVFWTTDDDTVQSTTGRNALRPVGGFTGGLAAPGGSPLDARRRRLKTLPL
jgi:hypothetical protein